MTKQFLLLRLRLFLSGRFFLFLLVGALNTVVGYSIFCLLIFMKLHYASAVLLATILGVLFNFKTIGGLVFNTSNNGLFLKFVLVYVVVYIINISIIKLMLLFSDSLYLDGACATAIAALFSYSLNKKLVFVGVK